MAVKEVASGIPDARRVEAMYASGGKRAAGTSPRDRAVRLGAYVGLVGFAASIAAITWAIATIAPVDDLPAGTRVVIQAALMAAGAAGMYLGHLVGHLHKG